MAHPLDQVISAEIEKLLTDTRLSPEMRGEVDTAFNAGRGERFKWAHLTLYSCECVNGAWETALPGAIAMEFFALAADVFDDIQDEDHDTLPWRRLSNAQAISLATCLLMLSYEFLAELPADRPFREVTTILSAAGLRAGDAQFRELLCDRQKETTLDQYFEAVSGKSGGLVSSACRIGARLGGAPEDWVFQLGEFGTRLGVMYQIRNDLHDFLSFDDKRDFIQGRKTLPYVYLLNTLTGETAERFKELAWRIGAERCGLGNDERDFLQQIFATEGVLPHGIVMYEIFRQEAWEIIKALPVPEKQKEKMSQLVQKSVV